MLEPLHHQQNIIGLLGLEFLEAEKRFSVDEIMLIERIGNDILQVREKARLVEQTQMLIASEERTRLVRDLHDSVTQVLFAASLVAEVLPGMWRRDPEAGQASLEELRRLTRGALSEMRTMLLELRPAAIVKTPLSDLLAQLTEAVTLRNNVPYQLFLERTPILPEEVHVCFYRVAQESLNNVTKHAHASLVSVSLSVTPSQDESDPEWRGEVKLMVRDNGRGFDVEKAGTHTLGLSIMRERAAAIGADLFIQSQFDQGTTVTLTWKS
jgi:signal transduction histidine kinase